jgi:hypothetical protein
MRELMILISRYTTSSPWSSRFPLSDAFSICRLLNGPLAIDIYHTLPPSPPRLAPLRVPYTDRRSINRKSAQKHRLRRKDELEQLTRAIAERDNKIAGLERELAAERARRVQLSAVLQLRDT